MPIRKPNTGQPKAPESKPARDEVAEKAHAIHQKEGHPQGHDMRNSSKAETKMPGAGPDRHAHMAAEFLRLPG